MNSSEKRRGREAAGQSPEEKKRAWGCRPATVSREITAPARAVRSARPPRPALEPSPTRAPLVDGRWWQCLQTLAHPLASTNRLPRRSAPPWSPAQPATSLQHAARLPGPPPPPSRRLSPPPLSSRERGKGKGGRGKRRTATRARQRRAEFFFVTSATCGVGHGVAMCGVDPMEGGARRATWCSPVRLNRWPALHFFDWTRAATGITGASQASLPTAYNTKSTSETTV